MHVGSHKGVRRRAHVQAATQLGLRRVEGVRPGLGLLWGVEVAW